MAWDSKQIKDITAMLGALSNSRRLEITFLLAETELSVGELLTLMPLS